MMADVISLSWAAGSQVVQHRRPASYGPKVVSFKAAQVRQRVAVNQRDDARRSRDEPSFRATLKVLLSMHLKGEIDDLFICYKRVGESGVQCVTPGERSRPLTVGAADSCDHEEGDFQLSADDVLDLLKQWTEAVSDGGTKPR